MPRNNMDNKINLKKLQEALLLQNIKTINFDVCFLLYRSFGSLKCRISITGNSSPNSIDTLTSLPKTQKKIHKNSAIKTKANSPPI